MVVDNGGAPCVSNGLLSLAICKPMIRKMAEEGSLIFGFGGKRKKYEQRLIYIASVTEKLPSGRGDYYRQPKYKKRPDCIYRETNDGEAQIRSDARYHNLDDQLQHDVGLNFERSDVLLSENFRYLGKQGTADYKNKFQKIDALLNSLKRGHRVNLPPEVHDELIELKTLIWKTYPHNFSGEPTDSDLTKICNTQSGSCVIYAPLRSHH